MYKSFCANNGFVFSFPNGSSNSNSLIRLSDRYESELAQRECAKRLLNHTKAEIVEAYSICFRVAINYMALKSRYDGLKSYIDILNGANTGYLATIKRIEELYDRMTADYPKYEDRVEFDRLCNNMPPEVWLQ